VEHQVSSVTFNIAKRCVSHERIISFLPVPSRVIGASNVAFLRKAWYKSNSLYLFRGSSCRIEYDRRQIWITDLRAGAKNTSPEPEKISRREEMD
jgi:hypothetical protein